MAEEEEEKATETEEYELTDAENEPALIFPASSLGQIKGLVAANGQDELSWEALKTEKKRVVYIFDALSGLRFYLCAQVVNEYLKITTEMGQ